MYPCPHLPFGVQPAGICSCPAREPPYTHTHTYTAQSYESSFPPFMNRSQVMTHPITPPKGNPVYSFHVLTRSLDVCDDVVPSSPLLVLPVSSVDSSNVFFERSRAGAVSIVPRYRPVRERQGGVDYCTAVYPPTGETFDLHGVSRPTNSLHESEINSIRRRTDFYRRALFTLLD